MHGPIHIRIRRVRPGICEYGDWFLFHNNAPSHNATIIKQFLAQRKVTVIDHPPYSPDLAPTDYFLFPKVKSQLEGAPLRLDFGHPESRDRYTKHHCKGRLLQRHPEAVWPCKSVCKVTRDLCRKLNNKSDIPFRQIIFIMPVLKLSRRTVYEATIPLTSNNDICNRYQHCNFGEAQAESSLMTVYVNRNMLELLL